MGKNGEPSKRQTTSLDEALRKLALEDGAGDGEFSVVEPRTDCPHVGAAAYPADGLLRNNKLDLDLSCGVCNDREENWLCVRCRKPFCSRYRSGHMAEHADTACCEDVIIAASWGDLSFWCFGCDSYIISPSLDRFYGALHLGKFGYPPPSATLQLETATSKPDKPEKVIDPALQEAANWLCSHPNAKVLVVTGAGVSTAAGIPDFRSPGTGLYDQLEQYNLPEPMAVFDINFFRKNPAPFYKLAKELHPGAREHPLQPTTAHLFAKILDDKGMLLRLVTQNIDGLDRAAGVPVERLVEAHGSFATARCIMKRCRLSADSEEVRRAIFQDKIPKCKACSGLVKPEIVFFGEPLPDRFHDLAGGDTEEADLVVVIGTSLTVMPVGGLPDMVHQKVPRLLINRECAGSFGEREYDMVVLGDIEKCIRELIRLCQWDV